MRNAGRLKLGYFPLPTVEGHRLRRLLHSMEPFSAIDPCAGTGAALHVITAHLPCRRYGVELDAERAAGAAKSGIETVQGNIFDAHAKVETFSLLNLNPPYDSEIGTLNNQRMELLFLEHTYRWLVHGGVPRIEKPVVGLRHDDRWKGTYSPNPDRSRRMGETGATTTINWPEWPVYGCNSSLCPSLYP